MLSQNYRIVEIQCLKFNLSMFKMQFELFFTLNYFKLLQFQLYKCRKAYRSLIS